MIQSFSQQVKHRLILTLTLCIVVLGSLTIVGMNYFSQLNEDEITQTLHQKLASHIIKDYLLINNNQLDTEQAKKLFHELMILGPNFEFYIVSLGGELMSYSLDETLVKTDRVDVLPIETLISANELELPIYGDNPTQPVEPSIFSAAPIAVADRRYGYLYIIIGSQKETTISSRLEPGSRQHQLLLLLGTGGLFVILLALILSRFVTKPLARLIKDVDRKSFQNFQPLENSEQLTYLDYWQQDSTNEFHQLGSAFRQAHSTLSTQYHALAQNEQLRREMLAHLTHDLRTPMAALLGYLETYLLQHDTLSPEVQKQYINTANKNAKKVLVLLEQLFELASLDSEDVQVDFEQFPVAELVQDVIANFQVAARNKQVTLNVSPQDSSLLVWGDIEKIDRVFHNLIENALRHSKPNGKVMVFLKSTGNSIRVSVQDNGTGISKEDLPFIFDAHFKAKNSVRENTAHGGLGLAITKRLIELHRSSITVKSRLGVGTNFGFTLEVSKPV